MAASGKLIYLDNAATTPLDADVLEAMLPFLKDQYFNPSEIYSPALTVNASIKAARSTVAGILGVKSPEIIFCAGGSEANNLAINGIMEKFPEGNIIYSAIEHSSIRLPASKYKNQVCPVHSDGLIDLNQLEKLINDQTVLISIIYANNEIGTIQPLAQIAAIIQKVLQNRKAQKNNLPLLFHSDACQAGNYLSLKISKLGLDLMSLNGSKIYGPKQSGALYRSSKIDLEPLILGGGQEYGLRSGTENSAGIVGFSTAFKKADQLRPKESIRIQKLRDYLIDELMKLNSSITINGSMKYRLANNIHLTIPDIDNETLIMQLDFEGILIAAGSACNASKEQPSEVLRAIGLADSQIANSIRITLGRTTSKGDLQRFLKVVSKYIKTLPF